MTLDISEGAKGPQAPVSQELELFVQPDFVASDGIDPYDGKRFADYTLMQRDRHLAVIEAKKTSRDAELGREQALISAIRSVLAAFEAKRRMALVVMATGTGKTRTAAALVDVLMRARWARRVLPKVKKPWRTFKDKFLNIDCWGNFKFFKENPKGYEPSAQVPLPVRLFRLRLSRLQAALAAGDGATAERVALQLRGDRKASPDALASA